MAKKFILNLSTVISGGAGNYALQNHRLLMKLGYDSFLLVKENPKIEIENVIKYNDSKSKMIFQKIIRMILRYTFKTVKFDEKYFFYNKFEQINCYSASTILSQLPRNPDVIFVYWVSGFINAKLLYELEIRTKAKIYILMIDNAPITGGCHYPWDCKGYETNCESCPAIISPFFKNFAKLNLLYKKKFKLKDVSIVAATEPDKLRAKNSILFKSIPCKKLLEIIDDERFKPPVLKIEMKKFFQIAENKKVIFFGATFLNEERKGMQKLIEAINLIKSDDVVLLIAGVADIGVISLNHKRVGYLSEYDLIKAYQAADIFVCPSLEDSGPMMINQSIMCGTPVVAFNMGSAIDLVISGKTGYRARLGDVEDLAKGIDEILRLNEDDYLLMSNECRDLGLSLCSTKVFEKNLTEMLN